MQFLIKDKQFFKKFNKIWKKGITKIKKIRKTKIIKFEISSKKNSIVNLYNIK